MRLDQLITGNDTVQKHVASDREKQALLVVSPKARAAVHKEILPQLEEGVTSAKVAEELCESTKEQLDQSFKSKDEVYTRLILYKSIDQSDDQYLRDLKIVMDEWAQKTADLLDEAKVHTDAGELTLKVELDGDKADDLKIKVKDTPNTEDAVTSDVAFDLLGLRL